MANASNATKIDNAIELIADALKKLSDRMDQIELTQSQLGNSIRNTKVW